MMDNKFIYRIFKGSVPVKKIMHGFSVVYEWIEGVIEALVSGVPPVILEESTGQAMIDCKIYGNSVQDGTPTPDNPVEVQSCGDKSKNLINWDYLLSSSRSITKVENGYTSNVYYHDFFTSTHPDFIKHIKSVLKPNVTYTLSRVWEGVAPGSAGTTGNVIFAKSDGVTLVECGYWGKLISTTFSLTQEEIDSIAAVYVYFAIDSGYNTISELQLTEGDEVLPYAPYGYKIPIEVRGKNMFDKEVAKDVNNWSSGAYNYARFLPFVFKKGVHYTISMSDNLCYHDKFPLDHENTQVAMVVNSTNSWGGTIIGNSTLYQAQPTKINIYNETEDTYLVLFWSGAATLKYIFETIFPNFQIEEGTTATDYESYKEPITTNIYLDEPLYKVGDYADYIDFANGKVVRRLKKYYFRDYTSVDYRSARLSTQSWKTCAIDLTFDGKRGGTNSSLASHFINKGNTIGAITVTGARDGNYCDMPEVSSNKIVINIGDSATLYNEDNPISNWEQFNEAYIVGVLTTRVEEDITLPELMTHRGTNIISVGTKIPPSNVEIQYYKIIN